MDNIPQMPPAYQGPQQYPSQSSPFQEYAYAPPPPQQAYQQPVPGQPYPQYQQMPPNQGIPPNQQRAMPRRRAGRYGWVRNASGTALMLRGGLMAVVGIAITVISYANAQSQAESGGSGTYIVFTGLIVFGVIYFFMGFMRWLKTRR